jgi:hypothetical protein
MRDIQLTHVHRYWGWPLGTPGALMPKRLLNSNLIQNTVKMVFSYKIFTIHKANTCVALSNACRRRGARTFLVLSQQ